MKYKPGEDGEMVRPRMRGYKLMCCDCGAVHVFDFFVIRWGKGHKIKFRARRDKKATAAARRRKQKFERTWSIFEIHRPEQQKKNKCLKKTK